MDTKLPQNGLDLRPEFFDGIQVWAVRGQIQRLHPGIMQQLRHSLDNGVRFDQYQGQDILVFDEFTSQVPLSDMLNYLDRYPLMLPARYADRAACYTKVYIISNLPLTEQYKGEQARAPERWAAFCRRLTRVLEYQAGSVIIAHKGAIPNAKP